uniref:Neurotransmitter-gated ion-channel ligand-binding domain-containing protein n=1 Tax=Panagrolaimus sp. JU765 TaxID=591449 RepID=A0AC34QE71_9BILA
MKNLFFIISFVWIFWFIDCDDKIDDNFYKNISYSTKLTNFLLKKHERYAPPDDKVQILLGIDLVKIVALNELKQRIVVQVLIYEEWIDKTLSWNPADFDGIQKTWISPDKIWVSDITVLNALDLMNTLESFRMPVEVYYTGEIFRSYPALYTAACDIAIANFPLDAQKCYLDIASWGYAKDKLVIKFSNRSSLDYYRQNEEWALEAVTFEELVYEYEDSGHSKARFSIRMTRKPLHYITFLVIPCYMICILGIAGLFARFSTRPERQERFTLGITAIVSVAVYGTVVAEKIPHTSREVPMLLNYFLLDLLMLTLATIATNFVMNLNYLSPKKKTKMPPNFLRRWLVRDKIEASILYKPIDEKAFELWSQIAYRLDQMFFIIFFIGLTIPTIIVTIRCAERLNIPDNYVVEK